ncbi:tetratricopeptide repeat protein [Helicobacter muridarum]|nr:tetratricopeptide repeat protein [Helicobacter muridarum]STQ86152.1 cysteine-rich protein H [Helicobacter muridarum]
MSTILIKRTRQSNTNNNQAAANRKTSSINIYACYIILVFFISFQFRYLHSSSITSQYDYLISQINSCIRKNVNACQDLIELGLPNTKNCNPFTCNIIGTVLMLANRESEAIEYFKASCNTYYLEGCFGLGLSYEALQDYKNAKSIYQLACHKNHILSCYNLAMLHTKNADKRDYIIANSLLQKACKQMYAKACFNKAVLYVNGYGVQKSLSHAKLYFDKACDMGLKESCKNLDILSKQGIQMPTIKKTRGFYNEEL